MKWHNYYYRVIGFALSGAGLGLMVDELIHGPFTLTPANHEFWGMILFVAGFFFISRKPHGKDDNSRQQSADSTQQSGEELS